MTSIRNFGPARRSVHPLAVFATFEAALDAFGLTAKYAQPENKSRRIELHLEWTEARRTAGRVAD